MQDTRISPRQAFCVLVLFLVGSTIIVTPGKVAIRDIWLAVIGSFLLALPLAVLYIKTIKLTHADFYDMQIEFLGPVFGRISIALFSWFGFHIGSIILREYTEFIQIDAFPHLEQYVFAIPLTLLSIWCIRSGIHNLGHFCLLAMPVTIFLLTVNTLFSINNWNVANLEPILYDGIKPIVKGSLELLTIPFLEVPMVLAFCQPMTNTKKMTRWFIGAYALAALVLMLIYTRNMMVLGDTLVEKYYFPSYEVVKLASIGRFIEGLQVLAAVVIMIGYYAKITVFLYAATFGVGKLLKMSTKSLAAPVGLLFMALSLFVTKDTPDLLRWVQDVFTPYAVPIGLLLPLILWIAGTWKEKKRRRNAQPEAAETNPDQGGGQGSTPEETRPEAGA